MANITQLLNSEIRRLARKEVAEAMDKLDVRLKKIREDNSKLRQRVAVLEKENRSLGSAQKKIAKVVVQEKVNDDAASLRITAKGIIALRKRMQLSARDFAILAGVTSATVYHWEGNGPGTLRLRTSQQESLNKLRDMGAREARAKVIELTGVDPRSRKPGRKPAVEKAAEE